MQIPDISDFIIPALSGIGGLLGSGLWFRRWVHKTDKTLETLSKDMTDLKIAVAVGQRDEAKTDGALSQLQTAVNETNEKIGKHDGSLQSIWRVLETNHSINVPERLSGNGK